MENIFPGAILMCDASARALSALASAPSGNAVIGLALILLGNLVMFAKPEQLLLRRRLA